MNKSLALKKKLYLFFSLISFFLIFLYFLYFLFYGEKSFVFYFKINNQYLEYQKELSSLKKTNNFYTDRINRLKTNSIDLDYLDEQFRSKSSLLQDNEVIVFIK